MYNPYIFHESQTTSHLHAEMHCRFTVNKTCIHVNKILYTCTYNLLLFCCCAVTVVCFVTDIIIECMKILLLLFCILTWYIYLSPLQFAPYINHPFIVCLYISISADDSYYLFIQCCLVVMVTTVLVILSHV